jgi:(p)ppGpp synthase/HD superfamily hydrolase
VGGDDRGSAMAASVLRTARSAGVGRDGLDLLSRAHVLAMAPRLRQLEDDHHPLFLHPGRTVLILLRDADVRDPVVLAAAAVTESEDPGLDPGDVEAVLGGAVESLRGWVPRPGSETLLERLVSAPAEARLVALAERLDHLRHAHLGARDEHWRSRVHAEAEAVYLPVAERTHALIARRYRHWCRTFARRLGETR